MPRCLLVSNRLPLIYNKLKNKFETSSGGLVSAVKGLRSSEIGYDFEWLGFLTDEVPSEMQETLRGMSIGDHKCHPVIIEKEIYHHYYATFCNNILWPLFHYERSAIQYSVDAWNGYKAANELMADAILEMANSDDTIWINDFHLFLVPGLLKKKRPELKVAFFLHIPFPSAEVFRELPQREKILESLLTCDQLGFHDLSYLTHFRNSLERILHHEMYHSSDSIGGVYPISIDTNRFVDLASDTRTKDVMATYATHKKEKKWVLGIDRLDYIKGLILKLRTFEEFLKKYPAEGKDVQLVQVVIPSREESTDSQTLRAEVEELVSNINGKYGSPFHTPILYFYKTINDFKLSAFYQISEVMHVSSSRDGMNLVGLEYVASQDKIHSGKLLLSEFTGAHSSLSYATSINPWDIQETAEKLKEALKDSTEKQKGEMASMQDFLVKYNSSDWGRLFLSGLDHKLKKKNETKCSDDEVLFPWMKNLKNKRVMIFCDFDGTLAPLSPLPQSVDLAAETEELLNRLDEHRHIEFVIVSGREREFLQEKLVNKKYQIPLAACHGAYHFTPETQEWEDLLSDDSSKWKMRMNDILKFYTLRTPGSFYEDKGHSTTWHYRNSPEAFAESLSHKLFIELKDSLAHYPVKISRGKKSIEISSVQANKGSFIHHWLKRQEYHPEVIIAIGDDKTDEDMFDFLQNKSDLCPYCIKVGPEKTNAHYSIKDQAQVNTLLKNLLHHI